MNLKLFRFYSRVCLISAPLCPEIVFGLFFDDESEQAKIGTNLTSLKSSCHVANHRLAIGYQ